MPGAVTIDIAALAGDWLLRTVASDPQRMQIMYGCAGERRLKEYDLPWLPGFLRDQYGLDLLSFGPPLVAIYLLSDVGSVGGGWLSGRFMKSGMTINKARKLTMLVCALLAVPVMFAGNISNLWLAVLIIGIATAAHQGFSANLYALPGDVFPRKAVGSVVGIGGMLGGIGGMVFSKYVGQILEKIGTYTPIFIVAGSVYLIALLVIHVIMPKYEPAKV